MSQDDMDDAYLQLAVGHDEEACLARAKYYHTQVLLTMIDIFCCCCDCIYRC